MTLTNSERKPERGRLRISGGIELKMKMGFSAKVVDDAALNEHLRSRTDTWGALGALLMTRGGSYSPENAFFFAHFRGKICLMINFNQAICKMLQMQL